MGAPFRHTRTKLQQHATKLKGHLAVGYSRTREGLGKLDHAVQTVRAVHNMVAPFIGHTQQGLLFNENMKHVGKSYAAVRSQVMHGDNLVRTAVAVGGALHKHSMSIGL